MNAQWLPPFFPFPYHHHNVDLERSPSHSFLPIAHSSARLGAFLTEPSLVASSRVDQVHTEVSTELLQGWLQQGSQEFDITNEVVLYAIAAAVAIIPESLIGVLTLTMAVGTRKKPRSM